MLAPLVDLVLPRSCIACRSPGTLLCQSCARPGLVVAQVAQGVPVLAAGDYVEGLRTAIIAYKERGRRDLAAPLGDRLAACVDAWLARCPGAVLVPIPSAPAAAQRRGGDHVLRLARRAAGDRGVPVVRALRTTRRVVDSAGLGAAERRTNLAFAFLATSDRAGANRPAILVDDIVTTGATLAEAARALTAAGWRLAGAAVVAATPRRVGASTGPPAAARRTASRTWPTGLP